MKIQLLPDATAPFGPIYSLSKDEEMELRRYIEGALDAGIISPSTSSAGSPVMFVKKSDGSLRLCVDYRGLNKVTVTDKTALPIIKDMLRRTVGASCFSKIDLKSAFNLIRIAEGCEPLTAFRTKYGHYQYNVMPFGLKNAPAVFQAFINHVFGDLIDRGVLGYIDDLLIYTTNVKDHLALLDEVFSRLANFALKVNQKKCLFLKSSVPFLGHVVSADGLQIYPSKVQLIMDWKAPTNLKELMSFLGMVNYYREFIPNFSSLAVPLTQLTRHDTPWDFNEECLSSFLALKEAFRSGDILMQPDRDEEFYVECDASDYAIGSVLQQKDKATNLLRPIAFYSRKLTKPELNYEIYDKELLVIVESFKEWRYLLIGTEKPVIVFSDHDHKNLIYFTTAKILNRRQARWSQFLDDLNFMISFKAGSDQKVADPLSRIPEYRLGHDDKAVNSQVLLDKSRILVAMAEVDSNDSSEDLNDDSASESSCTEPDDFQMEQDWEAGQPEASGNDPFWFLVLMGY